MSTVNGFQVGSDVLKYNYEALENYNTPNYSSSSTYNVGDYVMYQGKLYKCKTAISTAEAWTSAHWDLAVLSNDVSDLKSDLNRYTGNIISTASVLTDMYIDGSTHYLKSYAGSDRTICVNAKPNTTYIFEKNTATVVRAGCGNTDTPVHNTTYVYDYVTNGTASSDPIEITTRETEHYIYIQMFIDGDSSDLKNLAVNLQGAVLYEKDETEDEVKNILLLNDSPSFTLDTGKFINATNGNITSQSGFAVFSPISLKKYQTIFVKATGYSTNVGMIAVCDESNTARTVVVASIDTTERVYKYTATEDCFVTGSFSVNNPYKIMLSIDFTSLFDNIENKIEYPQLYDNIACIGDSLTLGASGNGAEILTKNYPHFFEKLSDATLTKIAEGGASAKKIWDDYISINTSLSNYDCAIIFLGTNGGLTDTVSTDCDAEDYTQNADTNTGCYGKIVGKIKADAPSCKIFCVAGANEYARRESTMNDAVRDIASLYQVGLIDLADSILSDNGNPGSPQRYLYRPVDGIHYNALGYLTLANLIYDKMSVQMQNNLSRYT